MSAAAATQKRRVRKTKVETCARAALTTTKVVPQMTVTPTRASSARSSFLIQGAEKGSDAFNWGGRFVSQGLTAGGKRRLTPFYNPCGARYHSAALSCNSKATVNRARF